MIQYRRIGALVLGLWLGASIAADIAVTQNFITVDRFLNGPGSARAEAQINQIGRDTERAILRRNAGEENNWIFLNWERVELIVGPLLFILLLLGAKPSRLELSLCAAMVVIVVGQHFFLDSRIADLGRRIDGLPPGNPAVSAFWTLHGIYSGLEILKLAVAVAFAISLATGQKLRRERAAPETAPEAPETRSMRKRRRDESLRRLPQRRPGA